MKYWVYIVHPEHPKYNAFKVGVTHNIEKRLESLQSGNPLKLKVLAKIGPFSRAQAYDIEGKIHWRLRRFRMEGEWFRAQGFHIAKKGFDDKIDYPVSKDDEEAFQSHLAYKASMVQ